MAGLSLLSFLSRLWALRQARFTKLQKFALGLVAIGAIMAVVFPMLLVVRQWRVETYMLVDATVKALEERCNLLGKTESGKFEVVKTAACAETEVFLSSNAADDWQVQREGFVTLDYVASGLPQSVTLAAGRFDAENMVVGNTVPLHVNPNKLDEVETGTTWHNFLMTLLFAAISASMAVVGGMLFRWLTPELAAAAAAEDDDDDDIFEPRRGEG